MVGRAEEEEMDDNDVNDADEDEDEEEDGGLLPATSIPAKGEMTSPLFLSSLSKMAFEWFKKRALCDSAMDKYSPWFLLVLPFC
jgi:hypothetical protein